MYKSGKRLALASRHIAEIRPRIFIFRLPPSSVPVFKVIRYCPTPRRRLPGHFRQMTLSKKFSLTGTSFACYTTCALSDSVLCFVFQKVSCLPIEPADRGKGVALWKNHHHQDNCIARRRSLKLAQKREQSIDHWRN